LDLTGQESPNGLLLRSGPGVTDGASAASNARARRAVSNVAAIRGHRRVRTIVGQPDPSAPGQRHGPEAFVSIPPSCSTRCVAETALPRPRKRVAPQQDSVCLKAPRLARNARRWSAGFRPDSGCEARQVSIVSCLAGQRAFRWPFCSAGSSNEYAYFAAFGGLSFVRALDETRRFLAQVSGDPPTGPMGVAL
jgi:hypothetical protein